jgi:hypothetical protein
LKVSKCFAHGGNGLRLFGPLVSNKADRRARAGHSLFWISPAGGEIL